jgi:hypothetical protein
MSQLTLAKRGKRNTLAAVAVAASPIIALLASPASGIASPVRMFVSTQSTFSHGTIVRRHAHDMLA